MSIRKTPFVNGEFYHIYNRGVDKRNIYSDPSDRTRFKKSMDEFRSDNYDRLKNDFKNFMCSTDKPISKEELDKLYAETFQEYRNQYAETAIDGAELTDRINDIFKS